MSKECSHNRKTNNWQFCRRLVGEGKEEATYAEPVLDGKNNSNVLPQVNHQPDHQETTMFHFAQPYTRDLYRYFHHAFTKCFHQMLSPDLSLAGITIE